MGTTGHGIVYPESTGAPQAWVAFQQLADSVETALDANELDTGWVAVGGGIVTGVLQYRKYRGAVFVQCDGSVAALLNATFLTLNPSNALPSDARPAANFRAGCYVGSGFAGTLSVGTDGLITAVQASGGTRVTVAGIMSYPLG